MASSPAEQGHVHIEDAKQFVAIYDLLTADPPLPPSKRKTLRHVIKENSKVLDKYTTLLARLTRIYDHVWPGRPEWKGSGIDELFCEQVAGEGVKPTEVAGVLYQHLKYLIAAHAHFLSAVHRDLSPSPSPPPIRIGSPHSIALRILSAAFADWRNVFWDAKDGPVLDLDLVIANSSDLMDQLNASLLDLVVSYGPTEPDPIHVPGQSPITFMPFVRKGNSGNDVSAYHSRLVLICHPRCQLWLKNGTDANAGNWEKVYCPKLGSKVNPRMTPSQSEVIPEYERLRPLDLQEIDTEEVEFVRVTSAHPPDEIVRFFKKLRGRYRTVDWHEEALALARSGQAVAIVSEGTAYRRGITAFRLTPEENFTRAVGVFTRDDGIRDRTEVKLMIEYLEQFLGKFHEEIRKIKIPRFGDAALVEFIDTFKGDVVPKYMK